MKNAIVKELTAEKKRLEKALVLVNKTLGKFSGSGSGSGSGKRGRRKKSAASDVEKPVAMRGKPGPKPGRKSSSTSTLTSRQQTAETLQEIRDRKARLMAESTARRGGEIGQPV